MALIRVQTCVKYILVIFILVYGSIRLLTIHSSVSQGRHPRDKVMQLLHGVSSNIVSTRASHITRLNTNASSTNAECPNLSITVLTNGAGYVKHPHSFQRVVDHQTYVYSAFYDERPPGRPEVRIIGISSNVTERHLLCQIWLQNGSLWITPALPQVHPEGHGRL